MPVPVSPIPGTFFTWEDQSDITVPEIATSTASKPLFCAVFTSDKGKENWQRLSGQEWFDMYATNNVIDFDKHGQPLLQTAMAVNAGAEILCKRVCADDAYLANLAIYAKITSETRQKLKVDGNGVERKVYLDENGEETYTISDNPVMETIATIAYSYKTIAECETKKEVAADAEAALQTDIAEIKKSYTDDGYTVVVDGNKITATKDESDVNIAVFPLWVITDNGRGSSRKRIRIVPNYQLSKNYSQFFLYDMQVIEGSNVFPAIHFCLNPDTISSGSNISLQYQVNTNSSQIDAYQFHDYLMDFITTLLGVYGLTYEEGISLDLMFNKNKRAKDISSNVVIDTEGGVDLSIVNGQLLQSGTNGSLGDSPYNIDSSSDYAKLIAKAFAGYTVDEGGNVIILTSPDAHKVYDPIIYNVDRYKIDAVFDANYPDVVKRAIETLVDFREDFMYFRDMGITNNTLELVKLADESNSHTKFASTYCTYYDVIDPYSKKQITVTIMYHLAQKCVAQFNNGVAMPMAGIRFGFTIDDIVEDTLHFIPTICPGLNEKEDLVDIRVNYATYIDNRLVVETLFTSQPKYTQLSYSNNVLLVQKIAKTIRNFCPAERYSFIDGSDLAKYKADVEAEIDPFMSQFKTLSLEYIEDPYYVQNKIFYAALKFTFRDFVQTELFKLTAMSSNEI